MNEYIDPPDPGVYRDIPMAEYHRFDAASNSRLSRLAQSPAHLRAYLDQEREETSAMELGRLIHRAVLEPEKFDRSCTVLGECEATKGDGDPCTYDASGVYEGVHLCGTHSRGRVEDERVVPVSRSDMRTCQGIRSSIEDSRSASKMLYSEPGESEFTMIWEDPQLEITCKARMDRYSTEVPGGAIVDLKTTRSATRDSFERTIFKYKYYLQAAHYLRGARILDRDLDHFVIVAVEKKPPYGCRVYRISDTLNEEVEGQLYDLYHLYRACMISDRWPGYPDTVSDISVPGWAREKIERNREQIVDQLRRIER